MAPEARDAFVSSDLFGSFGRYALCQLKRPRSSRLAAHRELVLAGCAKTRRSLDVFAALAAASPPARRVGGRRSPGAKEYIKQLYRSLHDQGLLDANEFASLVRYAREGGVQPEPARDLRPKNAYNLLRLIHVAMNWLRTGSPELEMKGAVRERLMMVKRGQVELDSVLAEAEQLVPDLEAARDATVLPQRPDLARADFLLRRISEEIARRWLTRAPGPFGLEAPPPPALAREGE